MNRNTISGWSVAAGLAMIFALSGCAPVTISSAPPEAQVYYKESGDLIGTTPVMVNLVANDQELVVRKEGFFSKTILLSPIDPENIEVELKRRDRVLLLSKPDGAQLFVEGVGRVGRTPYRIDYDKPYRVFQVKASGYAPQWFTVPEDPEGNVTIDLDRDDNVMIVSDPKKANVFDKYGQDLGVTPLAIPAMDRQKYELRKDGYYIIEFAIDEETPSPFSVRMEREPVVIIYSDPEGAVVVHRGVTLGQTPYRHLVKEDMELEVKFNRYYKQVITVAPDSPRDINITLEPKPYVMVKSIPEGGKLYRSGGVELIGQTPVEILVEKDVALEMHQNGFDIKPFMLSPESNHEVAVPLVRSQASLAKTVRIDSDPSGAMVYRPGGAELIGKTPLDQYLRSERTYELQLAGFVTKIVTVAPDSSDSVVFALTKKESVENITVGDPLLNTPASF